MPTNKEISVILGNSSKRFSGVTSTMLQVLPHQHQQLSVAVLGKHHIPDTVRVITYWDFIKITQKPLNDGKYRIFHARRNDEMIQALIAKWIFRAKIKIVFTSTAQRFHSAFTRWLMKNMDAVISTCSAAARYIYSVSVDAIIPHGIDIERFDKAISKQQAKQLLNLTDGCYIGIFGRVRHSKGIDILIDAVLPILKQRGDVKVIVCGQCLPKDQSYQHQLQLKIEHAGLGSQIQFIGECSFDELPTWFKAMDIVTALSRNEGYGLTPLEAMASKSAVVVSNAGAWSDIVRDGVDGYITDIGDSDAVQAKIEYLIEHSNVRETMSANGYQRVIDDYQAAKEATSLCDFYQQLQQ